MPSWRRPIQGPICSALLGLSVAACSFLGPEAATSSSSQGAPQQAIRSSALAKDASEIEALLLPVVHLSDAPYKPTMLARSRYAGMPEVPLPTRPGRYAAAGQGHPRLWLGPDELAAFKAAVAADGAFELRVPAGAFLIQLIDVATGLALLRDDGVTEVKAGATVKQHDFRGLRLLQDDVRDRFVRGVVLYTGPEPVSFGPRLVALPLESVWRLGAKPAAKVRPSHR